MAYRINCEMICPTVKSCKHLLLGHDCVVSKGKVRSNVVVAQGWPALIPRSAGFAKYSASTA